MRFNSKVMALAAAFAVLAGAAFAQGDDSFYQGDETETDGSGVELSGTLSGTLQYFASADYFDDEDRLFERTTLDLDLLAKTGPFEFFSSLGVEPGLYPDEAVARFDEAYARVYLGAFDAQLGWLATEWGKGDSLHAVDVLAANDLRWFMDRDDRTLRVPQLALKGNLSVGDMGKLEAVYLPFFTPDTYAKEGAWMFAEAKSNQAAITAALTAWAGQYWAQQVLSLGGIPATPTPAENLAASLATSLELAKRKENIERPADTKTFEYGQGGLRFTTTSGSVDWGVTLFTGYLRDPIVTLVDANPATITAASDPHIEIDYERMFMGGVECATAIAGFNLRAEGAVRLTKDLAGDDPDVKNGVAGWVFGFDRDLPFGTTNLNVQAKGDYVLFPSKADAAGDVDYADDYTTHMVVARLEEKLLEDKLSISLAGVYEFEGVTYAVRPEIAYTWKDVATLSIAGRIYGGGSESFFGQFDDNDSVQLSLEIVF